MSNSVKSPSRKRPDWHWLTHSKRLNPGEQRLWSSFFGHADQMVGLCTGGQLGGRAGQRFVLCG
ncbi:hypothetical protein A6D82_020055 [Klebsiella pneumoniae]|nr:hypothetical protein A6D82_020055 [Klebsiella pneumoniae]